jgi:hypothetical protein
MDDSPNPVRTNESHALEENLVGKTCQEIGHYMISIKTGAKLVRFVERCAECGWIDPASLDWWAEDAIKNSNSERSKRIAIAAETQPFQFVQSSGEQTTLEEILFQALGAASVCWETPEGAGIFDSTRAKEIGMALLVEVNRALGMAQQLGAHRALGLVKEVHEPTADATG